MRVSVGYAIESNVKPHQLYSSVSVDQYVTMRVSVVYAIESSIRPHLFCYNVKLYTEARDFLSIMMEAADIDSHFE